MAMKSAFCSTTLKKGSIIVGWINLAYTLCTVTMQLLSLSDALGYIGYPSNSDLPAYLRKPDLTDAERHQKVILRGIFCGSAVMNVAMMISLIYGAYKGRLWFLVPYLFFYGMIEGVLTLYSTEWCSSALSKIPVTDLVLATITIPIYIYFYCIVWFYFRQLWSERKNLKDDEVKDKNEKASPI